jgi:glutamyl-tRNA synthetase
LSEAGVTGRFAPSPTGPLHLGSLRTALAAWLMARSSGGNFILRIEDLDPDRSRPEWETSQLNALAAIGLDWDGAVLRQSRRSALYADALEVLQAQSRVYACFCTRAEIRTAASAPHGELPAGAYPGTCRSLSPGERAERIGRGDRFALRFDAGSERICFIDRLAGPQSSVVDDFVLRRADGVFAYQLAVVVDDGLQGITQVLRGADLLDSVGRQVLLMRALGQPEPEWAHVPLVMGPDGRRLAKRFGSMSASGPGPAPMLLWLAASLGLPTRSAPGSARELLDAFDPAQIPSEPVVLV